MQRCNAKSMQRNAHKNEAPSLIELHYIGLHNLAKPKLFGMGIDGEWWHNRRPAVFARVRITRDSRGHKKGAASGQNEPLKKEQHNGKITAIWLAFANI